VSADLYADRARDAGALVTVRCDCGTEHHVTVALDPKQVEAAVRRVLPEMAREARYRGFAGGR
jgi:hypothetical protein